MVNKARGFAHANFVCIWNKVYLIEDKNQQRNHQRKTKGVEGVAEKSSPVTFLQPTFSSVVELRLDITDILISNIKLIVFNLPECRPNIVTHYVEPQEADQDARVLNITNQLAYPFGLNYFIMI